jgi:hypothetical protein
VYIVTIHGDINRTEIHNEHHKLFSGSVVKGINVIDSFTFSLLPDNPGFGYLHDFTTLVEVYNPRRKRYEFQGRVLCSSPQMNDKGLITQEATCESFLGFLCDSCQGYVEEKNWTVLGLLGHIINTHNAQVESYKRFQIGRVDVTDPNDNLYVGIQRENSWDTIKKKLIDVLGGEVRFRADGDTIYLDYLQKLGMTKSTEIALSRNMKSIVKEKDPSAFITRLIPLGAKVSDSSEERIDITSVNDGKNYIEDTEAMAEYGIHVGHVEFDDVKEPSNLLSKAQAWLKDNNKVAIKYFITALDLSLIDLDVDDFEVCNTYPVKNKLLGIDDVARINKKVIDVCDPSKTTIEIGESFKSLSELQREQMVSINKMSVDIAEIVRNYVTNQKLTSEINRTLSLIEQTEERIRFEVSDTYLTSSDLEGFAKASDLEGLLTSEDLDSYALLSDLLDYAKASDLDSYVTLEKLASEIDVTKESIDLSVKSTIANLDVSRRNLLRGTALPLTVTSAEFPGHPDYAFKILTITTAPLVVGQVYTFSADVEIGMGSPTHITVALYDKDTSVLNGAIACEIVNGHITGQITPNSEGSAYQLLVYAGAAGSTAGNSVTFTKVKLEKGDIATEWSAVPEEYASLEELSSEIALAKNSINLSVSSTYAKVADFNSLSEEVTEIKMTQNSISLSVSETKELVDNIEIGGRNLVLSSNTPVSSSSYEVCKYAMSEDWQLNTTYTISIKGSVNSGQGFGVWANGWHTSLQIIYTETDGIYKATFTTPSVINTIEPKTLFIFNCPNGTCTNASIEWIKLEKGNKATDWTPAPEDIESKYATKAELALTIETAEDGTRYSKLSAYADKMIFDAGEIAIKSDRFNLLEDGTMTFYWVDQGTNCRVTFTPEGIAYQQRIEATFDDGNGGTYKGYIWRNVYSKDWVSLTAPY